MRRFVGVIGGTCISVENPPVYEKPEVGLKRLKLTQICNVKTYSVQT